MAERRMFAKTIVLSDAFLDMPMSARCLYFTLGLLADDDGFVNSPRSIMRQCGASDDDMRLLIAKKFVLTFESGVIVIKHWRINNYLRNDRYTETNYKTEKALLATDENGSYQMMEDEILHTGIPSGIPTGIPTVSPGKVSIGKDSIGKVSSVKESEGRKFCPPTLEEVAAYVAERGSAVEPQAFIDFYAQKNWMVGKNKMHDWKAACRNAEHWERWNKPQEAQKKPGYNAVQHGSTLSALDRESIRQMLEDDEDDFEPY